MNDLISRQDAIDAFYKYPNVHWTTLDVMNEISKVPSAQPEIEEKLGFLEFLWNVINPNEMEQYLSMHHCGEEKIDE